MRDEADNPFGQELQLPGTEVGRRVVRQQLRADGGKLSACAINPS